MVEVLNLSRLRTAYLQNSHSVSEKEVLNDVGTMKFTLPCTDEKSRYCQPFHYVRWISDETGETGELYRIIKSTRTKKHITDKVYECEHVLATLADSVMPGYHIIGNIGVYTVEVLEYVLSFQKTKHWKLGECDFQRQFEYSWSNETVLNALWSVPNRFSDPYIWKLNTTKYPWEISLKKIDTAAEPQFFIRGGRNLMSMEMPSDSAGIITRIYPLGYGEGINQLTIKDVNNGIPYLQSPQSYIDRYGLIERYWVDRRFENPDSLKERAQVILDELQEPKLTAKVSVSDIYQITHDDTDRIEIGRIVKVMDEEYPDGDFKSYITAIERNRDVAGNANVVIANKPTDIASSLADLADRQRIETVYSQGATQIYAQSIQANASSQKGAILRFFIPTDMRIINFVNAKITLDSFRSYSKATGGGGAITRTSSSGGGSQSTSNSGGGTATSTSNGGGVSKSTASGGGTSKSTASGGSVNETTNSGGIQSATTSGISPSAYTKQAEGQVGEGATTGAATVGGASHSHSYTKPISKHVHHMGHTHEINMSRHTHTFYVPPHTHSFNVPEHSHSFNVPEHNHSFQIPSHTHSFNIPSHTHTISLPDHTHDIMQGIFEFGYPTRADIYVNGKLKASMNRSIELDISEYLLNDKNQIPRGSWLSVEVRPNDLAYVTIDLAIKGFVQSRGGGTY
jgi:phage minor structural protein